MLWSRRKANSRAQDENESSNTKKEEQKVETKKESPHRKDENNKTSERKRDYSNCWIYIGLKYNIQRTCFYSNWTGKDLQTHGNERNFWNLNGIVF